MARIQKKTTTNNKNKDRSSNVKKNDWKTSGVNLFTHGSFIFMAVRVKNPSIRGAVQVQKVRICMG